MEPLTIRVSKLGLTPSAIGLNEEVSLDVKEDHSVETKEGDEKEEVMGLDDLEVKEVLYIRSKKGVKIFDLKKKEWSISNLIRTSFERENVSEYSELNPFVISDASDEHMEIIVNYMKRCFRIGERDSPEKPLPRDTLPNILGTDYDFFRPILEEKIPAKDRIENLSALIMSITYFDIIKFRAKACAAMASMFVGKNIEEIRTMVNHIKERR